MLVDGICQVFFVAYPSERIPKGVAYSCEGEKGSWPALFRNDTNAPDRSQARKSMSPPSAHSVLGLPFTASKEEVRPDAHENSFASAHPVRPCFHVARNARSSKHTGNCACCTTRTCLLRTSGSRRRGASSSSQKLTRSSIQAVPIDSRLGTTLVQVAVRMRRSLTSNDLHTPCRSAHASVLALSACRQRIDGGGVRTGASRQRSTYSWGRPAPTRSSNGLVALVFCLPLVLAGVHVALCAFQHARPQISP